VTGFDKVTAGDDEVVEEEMEDCKDEDAVGIR